MALTVSATAAYKTRYPDAVIGLLEVSGFDNTLRFPALEERKRAVEATLRQRYQGFSRADFVAADVMRDYVRYYKAFDRTYHVLLQLESIVTKGKRLPEVSPLVDANFASELGTLVLTAAHDVAKLRPPVCVDIARPGDRLTQMNGTEKATLAGDVVMRDADGIACTILHGQDNRSPVSRQTTHVLYVAYGPPGVAPAAVGAQLQGILDHLRACAPECVVERQGMLPAQ
jgi:DNA/RNA-binding domain of Phe-tRNA-synthetase-like protein